VLVARYQLRALADTASSDSRRNQAEFALRLKDEFFTEKTRILIELIDCEWLVYENVRADGTPLPYPYFRVDESRIWGTCLPTSLRMRLAVPKEYSCFEIDDLLPGPFEDLCMPWKKGLLGLDLIYAGFQLVHRARGQQCRHTQIHRGRTERLSGHLEWLWVSTYWVVNAEAIKTVPGGRPTSRCAQARCKGVFPGATKNTGVSLRTTEYSEGTATK